MNFAHKFLNQYKRTGRPWLIYRTDKKGLHSHLIEIYHVFLLKDCLRNNKLPHHEDYKIRKSLIESAKKLCTKDEFSRLKKG